MVWFEASLKYAFIYLFYLFNIREHRQQKHSKNIGLQENQSE